MTARRVAVASLLLAAIALSGCSPRALVLLPTPPSEVRKEPAAPPSPAAPPIGDAAKRALPPDNTSKAATPPSPDWGAMYREAIRKTKEAIARGSGREAIPLWKELEAGPFRSDAVFHQGVLLHQAGDLDAAAAQYRRLTGTFPVFEPAAANLLGIHLVRGDLRSARLLADRLLPGGSTPPPGMLPELASNIAALLVEEGELDRAALIFLALRAQGRGTPALGWNMAVLACRRGDPETARRLAADIPPAMNALWPVAASRFAWERDPGKIPALDNVPHTEPRMAALSRNLAAYEEYLRGNREAARRLLTPPPGETNALPQLTANLGVVQAESGLWKEARATLEQAVRDAPRAPEGWLNLGLFREVYEGNAAGALECYENYVKLSGSKAAEVRKWIEWLRKPASP